MKFIRKLICEQLNPYIEDLNSRILAQHKKQKEDQEAWREAYQERQNEFIKHVQNTFTGMKEDRSGADALLEIAKAIREK